MPITSPTQLPVPLGNLWTHARAVTWLRGRTTEYGSEDIQTEVIRQSLNIAISHVADLLAATSGGFYDWYFQATMEPGLLNNWVPFIDLSLPVSYTWNNINPNRPFGTMNKGAANTFYPTNIISEIKAIAVLNTNAALNRTNTVMGPLKKVNMETLIALSTIENTQWNQSMAWVHSGHSVLLFFGQEIDMTGAVTLPPGKTYFGPNNFLLHVRRNPILDTLLHPQDPNSDWNNTIDIPDRYIRLVLLMAEKSLMEILGKQEVTGQAVQEIAALTQQITGTMFTLSATEGSMTDATPTQRPTDIGGSQ